MTRRQQQVQAMVYDIADTDADPASDDHSYETMSLRFREARETTDALWHWQEVEWKPSAEDAERDALGVTGGTSLAAPLPADTCAIFLAQECKPPVYEDTPPACRASAAARDTDTDTNAASDFEQAVTASPTANSANALLTARDAESLDSSISPGARAIKACTAANGATNTARSVSTPERDTPGSVLDDFSLADTFIAQPPPPIFVLASERASPSTRQSTAHASMPVFAAGMPLPFLHLFSLPAPRQLLLPFTHRLPPLLAWDLSLSPPPPPSPARKSLDCVPQAPIHPLSLDGQHVDLRRDSSGKEFQEEAPSNSQRVASSGDTDDAVSRPTLLSDTEFLPSASPDIL